MVKPRKIACLIVTLVAIKNVLIKIQHIDLSSVQKTAQRFHIETHHLRSVYTERFSKKQRSV